jgi:phage terminase small subunit
VKVEMSLACQDISAAPLRTRSRVTNGKGLFLGHEDARKPLARRFRDLVRLHSQDASPNGPAHLSQAQQQLIRRIAMIETRLEMMEGRMVEGDETVSLEEYCRASSHLRRMLESLGLRKVARDQTPSLAELVAAHNATKPATKAAERVKSLAAATL